MVPEAALVLVWASPDVVGPLRIQFGPRLHVGVVAADGWAGVEFSGADARVLAGELAGWGRSVRLSGPPEVVAALAAIGAELVESYAATGAGSG